MTVEDETIRRIVVYVLAAVYAVVGALMIWGFVALLRRS